MKFISTRGQAPTLDFDEVVLTGLAADGGLYIPAELPKFDAKQIDRWRGLSYVELAVEVLLPFVETAFDRTELQQLLNRSYQNFRHPRTAPLVSIDENLWVLELFHGPTLAFKDFALQFLGNVLNALLKRRGQRAIILGATSGDTGSAAIQGCRECDNIEIFILHPHQRVSEVQRRQMTTVLDKNVHNIAVKGNFDDCQSLVKQAFLQQSFLPDDSRLIAVNSINWARIMAQTVYYFYAALALGGPQRAVSFSVPTGNFGDIFAGYLAKQMGLPIERLLVATNQNDILHRCLSANDCRKKSLQHSLSPSMDIMVSSNFERLLFDLYNRDGNKINQLMQDFDKDQLSLDAQVLHQAAQTFGSGRMDDEQLLQIIEKVYKHTDYLLDPHSAIGVGVAQRLRQSIGEIMICLATAHPAKFPQAYAQLPTIAPTLPDNMVDLHNAEERFQVMKNSFSELTKLITETL